MTANASPWILFHPEHEHNASFQRHRAKVQTAWSPMRRLWTSYSSQWLWATLCPQPRPDHCLTGSGLPALRPRTSVHSSSRYWDSVSSEPSISSTKSTCNLCVDWSLMFWFRKDGYQQFLLASVFKVELMLQQTLHLICVSIVSSARPPCTCMCLLSNRTSSCTASTPTHWTRTTLQTCSGKLLCPRLWPAKKFNHQGANGTVLPLQICSWAVQRPLLADMRPCHPGPTLLSARSLRGAQPDVQFHQEYALNWTPDGIRPLRWDVMRCFTDFLLRRIPMCSDLTLCGRRIEHRHRRSSPPVYVTQHWLEVSTQPIRCQESIETFWKIKGRFIKENKLSF